MVRSGSPAPHYKVIIVADDIVAADDFVAAEKVVATKTVIAKDIIAGQTDGQTVLQNRGGEPGMFLRQGKEGT